jgi:hypothetical protein
MSKTPTVVLVGSCALLVFSFVLIGVGFADVDEIDVEREALFKGTSGTVQVEEFGSYSIFVNDQYTCDETTVSISDENYEYFNEECDEVFDETGWRAIGVMSTDTDGVLDVQANHEILIIDDIVYLSEGGLAVMGGGLLCCFSIIGVIIGLVLMTRKKPTTVMMVQHPGQLQNFQQMPLTQSVPSGVPQEEEVQEPVWNFPENP